MTKPQVSDFLESIRIEELLHIETMLTRFVRPTARILEVGAGTGWQARALAARGYDIEAIDIPDSNHRHARIWPIVDFDGSIIPYPDASFDVVYSSNVLEHVGDIVTLNSEIARVLRPDGMAVHYVPTSAWRTWSLLAFYPALVREAFRRLTRTRQHLAKGNCGINGATVAAVPRRPLLKKILRRMTPHAHGTVGTCFTELLRFRRCSWDVFFTEAGWTIASHSVNGLFLTGEMLLGAALPIGWRRFLSGYIGSTAHLYVLKQRNSMRTT